MKNIAFCLIIVLFAACNHGIWVTQDTYRPKHAKFRILKKPFVANVLIDPGQIYISTKRLTNYDGRVLFTYMGFYNNGRMIFDNTWENEMSSTLQDRNSITTATTVGYYTTNDNIIEMELFMPDSGGGYYDTRKGVVMKDTIVIIDDRSSIFGRDIRKDTLVKSSFQLK